METNDDIVAFVGSGKLTKSLISGLLLSGKNPRNIMVIQRPESKTDMSWFLKQNVIVTTDMQKITEAYSIVIAILPKGVGETLKRLKSVAFPAVEKYEIISLTSGLTNKQMLRNITGDPKMRFISGTCNTNVFCGRGVICLEKGAKLFAPRAGEDASFDFGVPRVNRTNHRYESILGTVLYVPESRIHFAITTIGSAPAIDYTFIKKMYYSTLSPFMKLLYMLPFIGRQKFSSWLRSLDREVANFKYDSLVKESNPFGAAHLYLKKKIMLFSDIKFQYSATGSATEIVITTFRSCIETLLFLGNTVQPADLNKRIETIVTRGGCTKKGIDVMNTRSKMTYNDLRDIFYPILEKAGEFRIIVRNSIEKASPAPAPDLEDYLLNF